VLPDELTLREVELTVRDLDRAIGWYERSLGFKVHAREDGTAILGDGEEALVVLRSDPEAGPPGRSAGLYHYALLYPSRDALARAATRLIKTGTPIQGASDHGTHEAIYLPDADGNGIELAADRPREAWPDDLGYAGGPAPLAFESLVSTVAGQEPPGTVDDGMRMGHLHLHVGDIQEAIGFYRDLLGLEVRADIGSAAFLAAGGYHHHLGVNVWNGPDAGPPPEHSTGLRHWTIELPSAEDVEEPRRRLTEAGHATQDVPGGFGVRDPWGTPLRVVAR
jgi:catechol 2,3-dioxygenase